MPRRPDAGRLPPALLVAALPMLPVTRHVGVAVDRLALEAAPAMSVRIVDDLRAPFADGPLVPAASTA